MENSYDSAAKWSDSNSPYNMVSWSLQSDSSDSDLSRFNLGFSSSSSGNFPADEFVGGIEKAESLSRSHRLAEKRRRDRINSHLSALRKLVPNSDKLDKAALLATVIEQVKELKHKATESPIFQELPTEADEVTVQPETISSDDFESDSTTNRIIFKASFCCEDQPEAISEIIRVLTKFQLETIQAEIICVGGRMRINFILKDCCGKETTSTAASAKALKQSLCAALNRITSSSSSVTSVCRIRSKRQRWFLSSHYSQ
ncbi:unnamed protein product [Thlaspi arvense]|uniref:BHLH domain-containing protein n=1 Tax=Thlaspi arvense TaxID=13288 RepID=A0AAU9S2Q8_THLAR|nr:unnamed protein product [Thlaspi arvense]